MLKNDLIQTGYDIESLPVSVSDWQTTRCISVQRDTLHWPVVATAHL